MHFMKTVAVFITGIFPRRMIDRLMLIAPFFQAGVDVILVGVQPAARLNQLRHERLDGHLLNIGQHANHHFARALQQSQDRRFLVSQCASSTFAFQAAPTAFRALWTLSRSIAMSILISDSLRSGLSYGSCSAEKIRRGSRYAVLEGPEALVNAWLQWVMVSNEARSRGLNMRRKR